MRNFTGHPAPKNNGNGTGHGSGHAPIGSVQPGNGPYAGIRTIPSGTAITFGNKYVHKDAQYDRFWQSGGSCQGGCHTGEWNIDATEIPEQFRKYAAEIDRVFNDNVEHGCCGGCR